MGLSCAVSLAGRPKVNVAFMGVIRNNENLKVSFFFFLIFLLHEKITKLWPFIYPAKYIIEIILISLLLRHFLPLSSVFFLTAKY